MKQDLLFKNEVRKLPFVVFSLMFLFVMESYGQTITNNTQGTHDGFFYSFWNDGQSGSASMTLGPAGNYSTTWNNINNFTAGKGWKPGKPDRVVCFEGTYNGGSNGFLAVYGWTTDPLIEYYVVESYGNWTPPGNTSDIIHKGSFTSDGGTYNIYVSTRTNKPSIIGTATFQQYWSVRTTKRSTGTVTFANHVEKWRSLGMNMGSNWDYQIMESEGYQSSGNSNITVWECTSSCTPPAAPSVTSPVNYSVGQAASPLTASGTGLKWYTTASGGTGSSTAPTPNTSVAGTTVYYVSQTVNGCESSRSSITVNVAPCSTQPPSVTGTVNYTVGDVASPLTASGTNLKWYTTASGGTGSSTAPTPNTSVAGTTVYYVSSTANGCESSRASITVNVNPCSTPAPSVTATVNYEVGDVASPLTASGTNLKWYTTATGGTGSSTAPTPNTSAEGTTVYYVSSTNGCESSRASITVNVRYTYKVFRTSYVPLIDGEMDEFWQYPLITSISAGKTVVESVSNGSDLSGNIRFLWDNTNIYFYAVITDDATFNDSQNFYEDDGIEIYFDINNDKAASYGGNDVQYSFGWNDGTVVGALPEGRNVSGIQYVAVSTTNGYAVEGSIPWATLQGNPQEGQLFGLEFMINDDDNGAGRDGKLSWTASVDDAWQNPSLFGTAKLEAQEIITSSTWIQSGEILVFPNPAKDVLLIEGMAGEFEYKILDPTGRALQTGHSENKIELQDIQKGLYFLDLIQNDKKETVKVIVR